MDRIRGSFRIVGSLTGSLPVPGQRKSGPLHTLELRKPCENPSPDPNIFLVPRQVGDPLAASSSGPGGARPSAGSREPSSAWHSTSVSATPGYWAELMMVTSGNYAAGPGAIGGLV